MRNEPLAHFRYFGISPWEIEVIHSYFNARFNVTQEEIEQDDSDFVSLLNLDIPLSFNEEFFRWFDFRRWEKVKSLFKEMKRRRNKAHKLKIQINFSGQPNISFVVDIDDRHWYENAIEKIDFVLELLPYHLDPEKLPEQVSDAIYKFDPNAARWRLNTILANKKKFIFKDRGWRLIT